MKKIEEMEADLLELIGDLGNGYGMMEAVNVKVFDHGHKLFGKAIKGLIDLHSEMEKTKKQLGEEAIKNQAFTNIIMDVKH